MLVKCGWFKFVDICIVIYREVVQFPRVTRVLRVPTCIDPTQTCYRSHKNQHNIIYYNIFAHINICNEQIDKNYRSIKIL